MTMRTPLLQTETSDERLTAIETYLPSLATREDVIITREYMERALRDHSEKFHEAMNAQSDRFHEALNAQSEKFHEAMNAQSDRFHEAMNAQSDRFHEALNAQSDKFTALMLKQTADMQAQMRSDRRWTIGTIITIGLAIAALIIGMSG